MAALMEERGFSRVPGQLGKPIIGVCRWLLAPEWAVVLMPKATVYKDHLLPPREHKIGGARQITAVESIAVAHGMRQAAYSQLRFRIRLADTAHVGA